LRLAGLTEDAVEEAEWLRSFLTWAQIKLSHAKTAETAAMARELIREIECRLIVVEKD
jgi:YesN/AraC family two-component response regulator